MALISFQDWLDKQDESTAFKRRRRFSAQGLMPPIPDAETHRHSTFVAVPGEKKRKRKRRKK